MSSQKGLSLPVALAGMCICAVSAAAGMHFYHKSSDRGKMVSSPKVVKDSMIPSTALYARLLSSPHHTPGLFKSVEAVVTVLRIVIEDSTKINTLEKMQLNQLLSKLQCCNFLAAGADCKTMQVVVLEGLPGSGKSTLAKNLGVQLNAARVYDDDFAYPPELQKLYSIVYNNMTETLVLSLMTGLSEYEKSRFEAQHRHAVAILRAVELIKLYYIMQDIISLQEEKRKELAGSGVDIDIGAASSTFVLTNYYHWLCARTLNSELFNMNETAAAAATTTADNNTSDVSPSANEFCDYFDPHAFAWPFDLPKPNLVIFLAVSVEDRLARLGLGVVADGASAETKALELVKQERADSRLQMAYSLVNNHPQTAAVAYACGVAHTPSTPTTVAMNASGDADTVLQIATEICEDYNIFPAPVPPPVSAPTYAVPDAASNTTLADSPVAAVPSPGAMTEIDEISAHLDLDSNPNVSRRRGTKSKGKSSAAAGKRISLGMYSVF